MIYTSAVLQTIHMIHMHTKYRGTYEIDVHKLKTDLGSGAFARER